MAALSTSIRSGDAAAVRAALAADPALAKKPQHLVDAGRSGAVDVLRAFQRHAPDRNAPWRGYRALHAVIQEVLHAEPAPPSKERVAAQRAAGSGNRGPAHRRPPSKVGRRSRSG